MVDDFVIARNPEEDSTLPFLIRLPLGPNGVVLKVRDTWPRTAKVYCHPAVEWPAAPEIVERVPVRSCIRRGAAIDLVLDRGRENRSQFVFTKARGRDMIFWQSARTARQARPNVTIPKQRASGQVLEIVVDSHERYPWRFSDQQATTTRRTLSAGDYGIEVDGVLIASVERKSLADLVGTMTSGKLRYLLAALADVPRSALVVEERYSAVFKLDRVRPAVVAEGLAEAQVRFPEVPIVFCETRAPLRRSGRTGSSGRPSRTTSAMRRLRNSPTPFRSPIGSSLRRRRRRRSGPGPSTRACRSPPRVGSALRSSPPLPRRITRPDASPSMELGPRESGARGDLCGLRVAAALCSGQPV